jgi:2-iminobutanoate/2-iminopropanoate deaminase
MPRQILGDPAGKPYSPGTRCGNMLFVSGQLGLDGSGNMVSGGVGPETRLTLDNLAAVLDQAGATLDDVTMANIYMSDLDGDYAAMNEVYVEYFGKEPPARATVEVSKLALGARVEISAIAVLG